MPVSDKQDPVTSCSSLRRRNDRTCDPAPAALPRPRRPRGSSGPVVPGGGGALPQPCRYPAGAGEPQVHLGGPSPQKRALQAQPQFLRRPLVWLREAGRRGFPPVTPGGQDLGRPSAPRSQPLAGSSPFGRSRSCHPRVPLGEGWKRPVAAGPAVPQRPAAQRTLQRRRLREPPVSATAHNKGNT